MSAAAGLVPGRHPALIIIDFVNAYITEGAPLYGKGCAEAREPAVQLLAAARSAGVPRLHTKVAYASGGLDGGIFFRKLASLAVFESGRAPQLAAFAPGLEPTANETLITKQYASAFFGTSLASTLTALGVDTLIIAGVSTSGCVRATAVDACQHGFIPLVVREAVGDRAPGPHEANLFDLQAKYAEVVSLREVCGYLADLKR